MNLTKTEIERKARLFAKNLLKQAEKNEPQITEDLETIALEVAAEMVGLEDKLKTQESLARKIVRKTFNNLRIFTEAGFSFDESFEKTFKLQSKYLNDTLRYTILLPLENYVFGFKQTLENLKRQEYKVSESKTWNAWKNVETKYDKGYRGIRAYSK